MAALISEGHKEAGTRSQMLCWGGAACFPIGRREEYWLGAGGSGRVGRGSQLFSQSLKLVAGKCLALPSRKKKKKSAVTLWGAAKEEGDSPTRNGSQTCKITSFTDIYDSFGCQLQEGLILHPCRMAQHEGMDRWGGGLRATLPKSCLGHIAGEGAV